MGAARGSEPRTAVARSEPAHGSSEFALPTYGCFTEGFATADLTDARTLLDALA
jgi:hypothetical protein